MTERKAILLGEHTYGYYYPDTNEFSCTHGGWSSGIELINDVECVVKIVPTLTKYKFIDKIPDGWNYT